MLRVEHPQASARDSLVKLAIEGGISGTPAASELLQATKNLIHQIAAYKCTVRTNSAFLRSVEPV